MDTPVHSKTTTAFYVQSAISFTIALSGVTIGILNLPIGPWIRAFLVLGLFYVVTSTFTLAKIVRDHQEASTVLNRVDKARLEKLLAEHDPFRTPIG